MHLSREFFIGKICTNLRELFSLTYKIDIYIENLQIKYMNFIVEIVFLAEKMFQSQRWYLQRLRFEGRWYINEGDTIIARNPSADICIFENRTAHCTLNLHVPTNKITITSNVNNKTYVNGEAVPEYIEQEIKNGDILGIGCTENHLYSEIEQDDEKLSQFFVFELVDSQQKEGTPNFPLFSGSNQTEQIISTPKHDHNDNNNTQVIPPQPSTSASQKIYTKLFDRFGEIKSNEDATYEVHGCFERNNSGIDFTGARLTWLCKLKTSQSKNFVNHVSNFDFGQDGFNCGRSVSVLKQRVHPSLA